MKSLAVSGRKHSQNVKDGNTLEALGFFKRNIGACLTLTSPVVIVTEKVFGSTHLLVVDELLRTVNPMREAAKTRIDEFIAARARYFTKESLPQRE